MLCSTIIPTVNRPSLERAVQSALNQNLAPDQHEIIVVNDSGRPLPDRDWLLLPQVKVINTNRCERSVACNVGAAVATGKYLKVLHDDDYLLPDALNALVTAAEESGSAWVYGALNRVDNDNRFMSVDRPDVEGNIFAVLVGGECLHPGASLINRDAFFQVGGFDTRLRVREDYDLECRLALTADFGRTDQIVVSVRIGEIGSTTAWERVTSEHRRVRENTLSATGALKRVRDSCRGDAFRHGHCSRAYLVSAYLNLRDGRFFTALSRLFSVGHLASHYILRLAFWQGLAFRSAWHQSEKQREEEHYRVHYA